MKDDTCWTCGNKKEPDGSCPECAWRIRTLLIAGAGYFLCMLAWRNPLLLLVGLGLLFLVTVLGG